MSELKECRIRKRLTQQEAASWIGISLRSYVTYENDISKRSTPKYRFLMQEMERLNPLDEEHGILTVREIRSACEEVFSQSPVDCCFLFGSYAEGTAKEGSDVNLVISFSQEPRVQLWEEELESMLHKRVTLLDVKDLANNETLIRQVLKGGIRMIPQTDNVSGKKRPE
jgi:hypothetical protein